ncbi:MAG: hypothetical protein PVG06_05120 [Desulfobacterales bacterium]|jgi:hypothetical protein
MKSKTAIADVSKSILLLFAFLLLAFPNGCSTPGQPTIAPQNRIPLARDAQQGGSWESSDATLEYRYIKESGITKLGVRGRARAKYDQFTVSVLFLDADGRILERGSIYNSGFRVGRVPSKRLRNDFENTLEIPQAATHMAFQSSLIPYVGR